MARRDWVLIGILLLVIIAGGVAVGISRSNPSASARTVSTPANSAGEYAAVAKGSLVPVRYAKLSFATGGLVADVRVKEGDRVKAGDVLASLDAGDFKLQVQAAQDAVDIAAATLEQLRAGALPDDIAAAEVNLHSAQAQLDRVKNGPTEPELAILQANLAKALAAVQTAQTAYDRAGGTSNPIMGMLPQSLQLQQAMQDYQIAKGNYELKTRVDSATIAAAEATVANAQALVNAKRTGARPTDMAVTEARVRQAKTALAQAQAVLAKATLSAPFDGTITTLALRQGEMIAAGAPALTLADLSQLRVETTDLDEWGAARVKTGQPVRVSVNAFAAKVLTGKVANIASQSVTLSTGDVSYVVTIALDEQDPEVRWGMTVKVTFEDAK